MKSLGIDPDMKEKWPQTRVGCLQYQVKVEKKNGDMWSYLKKDVFEKKGITFTEVDKMEDVMPQLDILYMTRVQRERFFNEADYVRLKDSYILDMDKLKIAKKDLSILHPLPRVNEISVKVDNDPRACYFKQVLNGKHVRMALIMELLGVSADEH